jgi:Protein of unknown function (DUF1353)
MILPKLIPNIGDAGPKSRGTMQIAEDWPLQFDGLLITVPGLYYYDGASIPPALWSVIGHPFDPQFVIAALAHDWAYTVKIIERKQADRLFRRLLVECGAGEWRAELMYRAVRLAGAASWSDSEEDRAYLAYLKNRILADGRNPALYGIA